MLIFLTTIFTLKDILCRVKNGTFFGATAYHSIAQPDIYVAKKNKIHERLYIVEDSL